MDFEDIIGGSSGGETSGGLSKKEKMILVGVAGLAILLLISRRNAAQDDGVDRTVYVPTTTNSYTILGENATQQIDNSISYETNNNPVQEQTNEVEVTPVQEQTNFTISGHVDYLQGLQSKGDAGTNSWVSSQMQQYGYENLDTMDKAENIDANVKYLNIKKAEAENTSNYGLGEWVKSQFKKLGMVG